MTSQRSILPFNQPLKSEQKHPKVYRTTELNKYCTEQLNLWQAAVKAAELAARGVTSTVDSVSSGNSVANGAEKGGVPEASVARKSSTGSEWGR